MALKLVIRKSDGKTLYAQGEKDFVEILLCFLAFPLGGVVSKFGGNSSLGNIDGLYKSITDFKENLYFVSEAVKNKLVDPHSIPIGIKQADITYCLSIGIKVFFMVNILTVKGYLIFYLYKGGESIPVNTIGSRFMTLVDCGSFAKSLKGIVNGARMLVLTDDLVVASYCRFKYTKMIFRHKKWTYFWHRAHVVFNF